jgi:hypothetical protein
MKRRAGQGGRAFGSSKKARRISAAKRRGKTNPGLEAGRAREMNSEVREESGLQDVGGGQLFGGFFKSGG